MFNFQNLNDYEFEVVCKDILQIVTGKDFRTYAKGTDGGVDIKAYIDDKIIAQAKHYIGSTTSNLISSLKSEFKKVSTLSPKEYYLFTSRPLSSNKIDEIYEMFKEYMPTKGYIFDGSRLNDLLNCEEFTEVVRKHYKLWIVSSNVLDLINNKDIFIDTDDLLYDIDDESKIFVKTTGYIEAFEILNKEHIVILQGSPGVGKTTISKMLVLFYASKGFSVRYSSDNSIKDIKKSLSLNRDKKEIILLDDFLGQHYLNLKEERPNEIKSLTSYVLRNPNKRLILNTRITILKEAIRKNQSFNSFITKNDTSLYVINLDLMSSLEKAKILYNHLFFKCLPAKYYQQLIQEKRYISIIKHKNYNPRIIEFVTKESNYSLVEYKDYYHYICEKLNNPTDVWEEEFEERIDKIDRILLYCVYSLTNKYVEIKILQRAFTHWVNKMEVDKTKDLFNNSLSRLIESMLISISHNNNQYIGVINPSINDYLNSKITNSEMLLKSIMENSIYFEQILKMKVLNSNVVNNLLIDIIMKNELLPFEGILKTSNCYYLEQINELNIQKKNSDKNLWELLLKEDTYKTPISRYEYMMSYSLVCNSTIIVELLENEELFAHYNFTHFLLDMENLKILLNYLNYDDTLTLIEIYKEIYQDIDEKNRLIQSFEAIISDNISRQLKANLVDELGDELSDIVSYIFSNIDNDTKIDYFNEEDDLLEEIIKDGIRDELYDRCEIKKHELGSEFIKINIQPDLDELVYDLDYLEDINNLMRKNTYDSDDYRSYNSTSSSANEEMEIDAIFQREYVN